MQRTGHMRSRGPAPAFDARGRRQERVSEYFNFDGPDGEEKASRKVTRLELLAIMTQFHRAGRENRWYRILWRWLTARRGSGPVEAVPAKPEEATP